MSSHAHRNHFSLFGQELLLALAKGLVIVIGLLPHRFCLWFGGLGGALLFRLLKSRRQVALDNLAMIYGDALAPMERERLARGNFSHLGAALLELVHVVGRPSEVPKVVRLQGGENLLAALAQGRGVVMFSAHMGNFVLMPVAFAKFEKVKFLYRAPTDPVVARIYRWMIDRMHVQVIEDNPRPLCALKCIKHLRGQGVLGILIDQVENGGIYVDFMGKPAGSTLGAANMALSCRAPLVPMHCVRLPDRTLEIVVEPEFQIVRDGELEKLLEPAVAGMNKVVEKWVRAQPGQWFWGHRRWRTWRK